MRYIEAENVNDAYYKGMQLLRCEGVMESSRAGEVIVAPWPVMTSYSNPTQRVLFDENRDANPFFHLMESFWMLSGSRDGSFLDKFVGDFTSRYGESDKTLHGAYGHRWRRHFELEGGSSALDADQFRKIATHLEKFPNSRRAVLTMWDPNADLDADKRDIPCNTHVYITPREDVIDIGVCCRSNDIIWGAYGANAVHMSVMGEVLTGLCGKRLGRYYQLSFNYHLYTAALEKIGGYPSAVDNPYAFASTDPIVTGDTPEERRNSAEQTLMDSEDLVYFCDNEYKYRSSFFRNTVSPMLATHILWRQKRKVEALITSQSISSMDWRIACQSWMHRRCE